MNLRSDLFIAPTVRDRVPDTAEILRDEIFGPVAPIVRLDDLDDAVAQANDTEFGLGREGGHEGLLDYTEATYVATSW